MFAFIFASCMVQKGSPSYTENTGMLKTDIENLTQSLFSDKDATITEENIQRILDGTYDLPKKLRVGIVNLENKQYKVYYWNDEDYLSSRQKYLDTFSSYFNNHSRVESVSFVPQILLPDSPTFTAIREAAIKMQVDLVLVYSVSAGMYSNYKLFQGSTYKAFATTQVLVIDTRRGLVPFTRVVSEDVIAKKEDKDFNSEDARKRIQEEAVMKTLNAICDDLSVFLER